MTKKTTITLDGAVISIDGEQYVVEEGTLTVQREYLYDRDGERVLSKNARMDLDIELRNPEDWVVGDSHE